VPSRPFGKSCPSKPRARPNDIKHGREQLTDHITEPGLAEDVKGVVSQIGVPATTMASMVAFAMSQPDDVDVNEILFRPTVQPV
jgi:NADP-dependent 3-hydroxy acid dehydrogenase YdfG